jgi:hypothetical protein
VPSCSVRKVASLDAWGSLTRFQHLKCLGSPRMTPLGAARADSAASPPSLQSLLRPAPCRPRPASCLPAPWRPGAPLQAPAPRPEALPASRTRSPTRGALSDCVDLGKHVSSLDGCAEHCDLQQSRRPWPFTLQLACHKYLPSASPQKRGNLLQGRNVCRHCASFGAGLGQVEPAEPRHLSGMIRGS